MQNQKGTLLLSFITALCVVNVSGPQYVFPIYGPSLAKHFHWSSIENSMVSTAVFVGVSFSSPLCAWLAVYLGCKKYKGSDKYENNVLNNNIVFIIEH